MKKFFSFKYVLYALLSIIILLSAVFCFSFGKSYTAEANDGTIENIYDETLGKFYFDTLNQLAAKAGYKDVSAMASAAAGGEIKTASDFGETRVKFGKDARDNSELEWFPAYLSNSDEGPVLTLWLSNSAECSAWTSNETYSMNVDVNPSPNNYSTGKVRVKELNNGGTFYGYSSNINEFIVPTPTDYIPTSDGTNKYEMYTTGVLSDYIVAPCKVDWQANANYTKNDPKYNHENAKGHYTHNGWVDDKIWLPSVYEVYDNSLPANSFSEDLKRNGGLWNLIDSQLLNDTNYWLRSSIHGEDVCGARYIQYNATINSNLYAVALEYAVRPALHLNLTKAVQNAVYKHVHSFSDWEITTPATCLTDGEKARVCTSDGCDLENNTETEVIPALGHEWSTEFTIDIAATCTKAGSKSKHCTHLGCNEKTEVTAIAALQHDWGEWTVETAVTCEKDGEEKRTCKRADCGGTETRTVVHEGHKYVDETTPPTCTEDGYTTHTCSVCGNSYKDGVVKAEGHKYGGPLWKWNGYISATAGFECENCNDCQTVAAIISNEVTKEPTYTEDGERTYTATVNFGDTVYTDSKTETINMNSKPVNSITFEMSNVVYGDEIEPVATASYGTVIFTYSEQLGGTYAATKPKNVGTYYVKASVAEGADYLGAEEIKEFKILAREITVTINSGSSIAGDPLEALTATVTSGSIVNGDSPYTLSTNADKDVMGTYAVTGVCTDGNYDITFIDGVYIVSKKLDDSNGGGEIDIPRDDIDVEFKVTQSSTNNAYSELEGLKQGYWAQLWYRNEDGTLGDEYVDTMNCILTLKIPEKIIEGIRGGEEINREKIAAGLSVYYVDVDGALKKIEAFTIAQKEDESWIVKFNYNAKFRAEIVFNAAEVEDNYGGAAANNGTPWWVWLIVGLAGAAVIGVAVVIIVVSKKKGGNGGGVYDDAELKAKLTEQDKKLDEIKEIVDGGFNDIADE